jgi:hypothetical protein
VPFEDPEEPHPGDCGITKESSILYENDADEEVMGDETMGNAKAPPARESPEGHLRGGLSMGVHNREDRNPRIQSREAPRNLKGFPSYTEFIQARKRARVDSCRRSPLHCVCKGRV